MSFSTSFIKIENKTGPKMEPGGTPEVIARKPDFSTFLNQLKP